MARIAFDHYPSAAEAAAGLSALKDVGLDPTNLGAAWMQAQSTRRSADAGNETDMSVSAAGLLIWVSDIGQVHLAGWLTQLAEPGSSRDRPLPLDHLFSTLSISTGELEKLSRTLETGGGIVAVKAPEGRSTIDDIGATSALKA